MSPLSVTKYTIVSPIVSFSIEPLSRRSFTSRRRAIFHPVVTFVVPTTRSAMEGAGPERSKKVFPVLELFRSLGLKELQSGRLGARGGRDGQATRGADHVASNVSFSSGHRCHRGRSRRCIRRRCLCHALDNTIPSSF